MVWVAWCGVVCVYKCKFENPSISYIGGIYNNKSRSIEYSACVQVMQLNTMQSWNMR